MTAALALDHDPAREFATRRWPTWPPPEAATYTSARSVEADVDGEANLRFRPPDGAYAALPAWRSRNHYVAALRWHPRLEDVCRRHGIAVDTFLAITALYAARADDDTGRNIAVANSVLAQLAGVSDRHVRNATRAARELGVLTVVLAGTPMSITQRAQVLEQYRRGHPSRRWRNLPNYAAACVPAELTRALHRPLKNLRNRLAAGERAALAAIQHWRNARIFHTGPHARRLRPSSHGGPVDNCPSGDVARHVLFHLPQRGINPAGSVTHEPYGHPLFKQGCGQTPAQRAEQQRTAAARPTAKHRQSRRRARQQPLNADLEAYAKAFRAQLHGFHDVSVRRIANALSPYRSRGLHPTDLAAGLRTYLRAHARTLYRTWEPHEGDQQAKYLVGQLSRAREAGYLIPGPPRGTPSGNRS